MERVLVTGGAGFIGSHLVDRLVDQYDVVVLDDLSGGTIENIESQISSNKVNFLKGTILSEDDVQRALEGVSTVFHFAAQPNVRLSAKEPMFDFHINMVGGMTLLEAMRKNDITNIVFASSGGTVYGDSEVFPTPEETALRPISNYGAAKCAFEMYLSSYSELYGVNAISMRLANILGPRLTHGVIFDFFQKLKKDSTKLEVLGTGKQEKAYMMVSDVVDATIILNNRLEKGFLPINVSSGARLSVSRIAELVCEELNLPDARIEYTGSTRGWAGDVIITDLSISLLTRYGWTPKVKLEDGIKLYLQWLVRTYGKIS